LLPKKTQVHPVEHHAALPYPKIGAFMAELRLQEGVAARALEFAILTASRSGEVLGSRWEEFNLADRLWTVPAARMKSGREHRAPLSAAALEIVENMGETRQGDHVFAGRTSGSPLGRMALLDQLARMGRARDVTPHGFRSTFRDWCAERTNFPAEVAEMALAHTIGDRVEAAYRRGDLFQKRRQLMDVWAKFCAEASTGIGRVVPIRRPV
jgi:integrase